MQRHRFVRGAILSFIMISGLWIPLVQADENAELKQKIEVLEKRIAELEKQNQPDAPAPKYPSRIPASALDEEMTIWDDMDRMQRQLQRMFENRFERSMLSGQEDLFNPDSDLQQTPTHYILTLDLPGMDKDKINIEVKQGVLIVSGERSALNENRQDQFFRKERSFGSFVRSTKLPDDAKSDDVAAEYKDGVLEIRIGRKETGKDKQPASVKVKVR